MCHRYSDYCNSLEDDLCRRWQIAEMLTENIWILVDIYHPILRLYLRIPSCCAQNAERLVQTEILQSARKGTGKSFHTSTGCTLCEVFRNVASKILRPEHDRFFSAFVTSHQHSPDTVACTHATYFSSVITVFPFP